MGWGERIRKWIAGVIWKEWEKTIEDLAGRLSTTHARLREMYWEEKSKEMAYARISFLEERLGVAYEAMIVPPGFDHMTPDEYVEEVIAKRRNGRVIEINHSIPEEVKREIFSDPRDVQDVMIGGISLEVSRPGPKVSIGCSVCMKPENECSCPGGFRP